MRFIVSLTATLALTAALAAQPAAPAAAPPPVRATPEEAAALAAQLRALVLQVLPDPLLLDEKKWNQQKKGPRGKLKNDGRWVKVRIAARNPQTALQLTVTDMVKEKARKTFTINVAFDAEVLLDRQTWAMGAR